MLKVLIPGLWTSIQDSGRFGFRHLGVPVSGFMDARSANLANLLLNNESDAAVMEINLSGPQLSFMSDTCIAITGADMSAEINKVTAPLNTAINVFAGDKLSFGHLNYGARTYVAIEKGFKTSMDLESRSFYSSISSEFRLQAGELIDYVECGHKIQESHSTVKTDPNYFSEVLLFVSKGPEFELLDEKTQTKLMASVFTVSNNDRMAYHLEETLDNKLEPILTSAVFPGTVQITPSGKLLILMRDAQTTGGYPRILQLNEQSINRISQKKLGDKLQFRLDNSFI